MYCRREEKKVAVLKCCHGVSALNLNNNLYCLPCNNCSQPLPLQKREKWDDVECDK